MAYVGSVLYPKHQSSVKYGEKTSEHGFYSPDPNNRYGGTNRDGTRWTTTYYKWNEQAAPAAAPAPAPAAPPAPLMPQISEASKKYRAETDARIATLDKKMADFNASEAAATKAREIAEQTRVRNFAIQTANQSRSGQTANLQIQPASSTPKTAGTQPFKRRRDQFKITKPAYSGLSVSQSGMVNV